MRKLQLGDRMKSYYEQVYNFRLPMRMPVIMRLDGKSFHTFTRDMERPFDDKFIKNMASLTEYICSNIQGAVFAYTQSDEISILIHNYKKLDSQAWFGNEVQKMTSISAGLASAWFTGEYGRTAIFDSRVFVLPESEVVNYFIWRQQDATRNSINMLAQSLYSHKQLMGKNTSKMQDMMMEKGVNWNDLDTWKKRGLSVRLRYGKWWQDYHLPIFSQKRAFIERYLKVEEE